MCGEFLCEFFGKMSVVIRKENGSGIFFKGCVCKICIDVVIFYDYIVWIFYVVYLIISVLKDFIKSDGNIVIVDVKVLEDNEVLFILSGRCVVFIDWVFIGFNDYLRVVNGEKFYDSCIRVKVCVVKIRVRILINFNVWSVKDLR